jgi:nitrile hydratase accessory protein
LNSPEAKTIGLLKRGDSEPVFDDPWQAQVLAMADTLSKSGAFTATEWSEVLAEELQRGEVSGKPVNAATYYEAALKALERLLIQRGIVTPKMISDRRDAWIRAYHATPHGQPVLLLY